MTPALERAFAEAAKLDAREQDALADAILERLHEDAQWDESFAASRDMLEAWGKEALAEHLAGRTKPLDPDAL